MNNFRTICAISTPNGVGGIAIIRISGPDTFSIVQKIVSVDISKLEPRFLKNCDVHSNDNLREIIDNGMIAKFVNPNSFTGENLIELNIHGGIAVQNKIMNELFKAGAIQAEAGDFTHRSFINGKIDLTEAEAIGNIIDAKTESALIAGTNNMQGLLSDKIKEVKNNLIHIAASLFVDMDFGEEGNVIMVPDLNPSIKILKELLATADNGIIANAGLNVAIVGEPNVGKSSLLNALLGEDRAIVTKIAGTTRDTLNAQANIYGHLVNFIDTAGLRETEDEIEQIGVQRAKAAIKKADLLLAVVDGDGINFEVPESKNMIIVRNKNDLGYNGKVEADINISAKTGENIDLLCKKIVEFCKEIPINTPIIANARQKNQVALALSELENVSKGIPLDSMVTFIENAIYYLSEITGENVSEQIVSEIFSKFCVGK